MTKYQRYYQLMTEQHQELFEAFDDIHAQYALDKSNAKQFHHEGQKVVDIIRSWERRLCSGMERGQHAQYSQQLAEKFWTRIKERFPLIEEVGVHTSYKDM